MLTLTRQLVSLDMVCTELADYSGKLQAANHVVPQAYVNLLKQFCIAIQNLSLIAQDYSQLVFVAEVEKFGLALPIKNKRILSVYLRLIEYVIDFYLASEKIASIRDKLFDDNAEKRLDLLQVRAIKAKAQFKTVVHALGKREYQQFAHHLALPTSEWGWDVLRLESE
ncbi:MAG: hypothetical protein NWQ54_14200 [Paraglaciecola sp.]|uniref:hypothetical protein n=1 Tax=Paraglaciecola sp. TaxID=1920173 RepID=UPI00273DB0F9|nr:hypothetical protein [Paraglaciecola sp.]MDP5032075.1 hypothetical protein [Paraglaciecola sp.]MDP5132031.1 hypothetical protein [Paraglaciecola sp.]